MTCIVGLVDGDDVYLGGDSAGVAGLDISSRKDVKVFFREGGYSDALKQKMVFGYTSSFRMGQLLRFSWEMPNHPPGMDTYEYMCTDFIESVRDLFVEKGYAKVMNNRSSGGVFLVGYRGRLFSVQGDFQVGENHTPFDACGCGQSYALGALDALTDREDLSAEEKVLKSLEAAERFSAGVAAPFNVLCLKGVSDETL